MNTFEKYLALRNFVYETERRGLVYGTSFSEYLILRAIHAKGEEGIRRVELSDQVGLTISGVTRALQPLEKQGYIETLEEVSDARVRKVAMTKSGGVIFEDLENDVARRMIAIHSKLHQILRDVSL